MMCVDLVWVDDVVVGVDDVFVGVGYEVGAYFGDVFVGDVDVDGIGVCCVIVQVGYDG